MLINRKSSTIIPPPNPLDDMAVSKEIDIVDICFVSGNRLTDGQAVSSILILLLY